MADKLETTMKPFSKAPSPSSGSGEFGGETAGAFGKHLQTKGANVIPVKTRDVLRGKAGKDLASPFIDAFKNRTRIDE